jgi:type I restriction enzyme M protein
MPELSTKEILDLIFKDPKTKYELSEFDNLAKPVYEIVNIYPKVITSGKDTGQTKYFLKSFVAFFSGTTEVQVFDPNGKSNPEEIVRQLWLYKLIHTYQYREDEIQVEKPIPFGSDSESRKADIVVHLPDKTTPKIVFEIKKPNRKDGIEQLKSYLNAQGAPIGVWSNGSVDRIILYRPYPKEFNDTLAEIPRRDQEPKDVLEARRTLALLERHFNFKSILESLEELVLADTGRDAFDEIFKIIFAKIYDEIEAEERTNQEVFFRKMADPEITYERINGLFKQASEKWIGIFKENDRIELRKDHLSVCIGPIERVRLMGSNLRIMDDAFEYLIPQIAKKKQGQFFTPRYVIDMCVRMLNPKRNEFVMDPACGSSGFLLHVMDWVYPVSNTNQMETRKHKYASKYLWGIDFAERTVRISKSLMLIAGDGHTNIFGPDVSSLNPKEWFSTYSGQQLMNSLRDAKLLKNMPQADKVLTEDEAWEYFKELKFDVIMTNPPFAGEIKDRKLLQNYTLAKNALKRAKDKEPKEERDVLFIERILDMLRPGGRAAIVLPQGKFNNSSLAYIREFILHKARLLAVVGLHQNTFKPHTGTKTSVMFLQKYTDDDLKKINKVKEEAAVSCPDFKSQIIDLLEKNKDKFDISEEDIPSNILELINELYNPETEEEVQEISEEENYEEGNIETVEQVDVETQYQKLEDDIKSAKDRILKIKENMINIDQDIKALDEKYESEKKAINETYENDREIKKQVLKDTANKYKEDKKRIKEDIKIKKKSLSKELKLLNKSLVRDIYQQKLLTNKGKLLLIAEDEDAIITLKERFVDAEAVIKLDYPIFMAVSEKGGKDSSGKYVTLGEQEEGVYKVDQDLINYDIKKSDIDNIKQITAEKIYISEAFISFAFKNKFDFWVL